MQKFAERLPDFKDRKIHEPTTATAQKLWEMYGSPEALDLASVSEPSVPVEFVD